MNYSNLLVNIDGAVATISLDRPDRRNAFDDQLVADITAVFNLLNKDDAVRAIVLKGEGKSFSAGADLEWMNRMAGYSQSQNLADAGSAERMFAAVANSPKVTIARVHGAALGGGAGLVAACDVGIAVTGALFAFSEVRLGLAPSIIAPFVLRKIGIGTARALFVTGRRFDAAEAHRIGLVQEVVSEDKLDDTVKSYVADVLQSGPHAITAVKKLLSDLQGEEALAAARALTVELIANLRASDEGQEGLNAFLQKRKPAFAE